MDISKLLNPKIIAIVGASEKESFGGCTSLNVVKNMKSGSYYFVNPKYTKVYGVECYDSISELPKNIDLVVICTPQKTVNSFIREAYEKGAKAAVVYASGYSEVGTDEGRKKEFELVELCKELDIALMGPNCAGFVNFATDVMPFAFISEERNRKGKVGVISQSGQIALSMMDSPKMKFSYAVSAGNSSVCKMEDYLEFLIEDDNTNVVAMYLEGVKNPEKFIECLKKAAIKRKPIIVLKTGRSLKGQALAASHTGSLSGSDKVFDALFKKFGVIRVDDLEELMSTANALSVLKKYPHNANFASMNLSGGETGICADLGELYGINFVDFSDETIFKLKELLPSYATPNNPLDMTATLSYDAEKYADALKIVMNDNSVGLVAVGYTLLQEIADPAIIYMARGMEIALNSNDSKPIVMIPFGENTRNQEYVDKLELLGIPVLPTSTYAFKILKSIANFISYKPENYNFDIVIPKVKYSSGMALSESESKKIVAQYNIPFPKVSVAKSSLEAADIAEEIGFPIVAKIDSPDILHKSDIGCVKLNLKSKTEVFDAYNEITENAKKSCPNARIDGVQINEMVRQGTEMIIGVNNDPDFGPTILCGLGGVFVEIFKDTALALAPLSKYEAFEMIDSLKGSKLLKGYRGNLPLDVDAFVEAIVNISKLACDHRDIMRELDINPIYVYEKDVCAVDALYVKK